MNNEQTPLTVLATYKHYKGGMYLYLGEAIQEDSSTKMAIYKELNHAVARLCDQWKNLSKNLNTIL